MNNVRTTLKHEISRDADNYPNMNDDTGVEDEAADTSGTLQNSTTCRLASAHSI
jgi:hypothetical protein